MRIVSLNTWGGTLGDDLVAYLSEAAADIFCLQEIIRTPASPKTWLTYRDGDHILPQRARLFDEIWDALPEHIGFFCPAAQGVLWDEDQAIPSQWGIATFVHKTFPVIGQAQGFVHKDFSPDGYGDHPRSRNAHGVRVYDFAEDRSVSITHMHGLRDLRGKMDTPERLVQAHRLMEISRQTAKPEDIQIICGDFNLLPDSESFEVFLNAGFRELVTAGGYKGTRSSHYKKSGKFADYMLVNDLKAVRSFEVVRSPEVSDHCPLELQL